MTNRYYNNTTSFLPGTIAKGDEVDGKFDGVTSGLDLVEGEIDQAVRLTNADITTSQELSENAATRANKVIGFDAAGALALKVAGADWKGDWTTATYYRQNDIVKDAAGAISQDSLFICLTAHTSTALASDAANWELMVDVETVAAATAAAQAAQAAAEAAYDSFDDRYLGAKAANPTLDNDGNALVDGALYFNTTANEMRVYDLGNTTWLAAYIPSSTYLPVNGSSGMTGDLDMNNNDITEIKTAGFNAEYDAGDSGTSKTISFADGQKQKLRLTGSVDPLTLSFTGCPVGVYQLRLYNNGTGGYSVTWSGILSTDWVGSAAAPSINGDPDASTIVNFFWNGTKPFGAVSRVGMI